MSVILHADMDAVPRGIYDLVSMIEVIEHLSDLWATLRSVHAALRPGGKLFVTTPNRKGWRARLEGGNWREARKKFHLLLFDEMSLRHHLQATGFDSIVRVRFSPVVKAGFAMWATARTTQLAGMGGTLCVIASRP